MKKLHKSHIFLTALLIFSGCTSTGYRETIEQEQGEEYLKKYGNDLSLREAIEIARERNTELQISAIQREIAGLDKKIAFANFLPRIDALASYNQFNQGIYGQVVGSDLPIHLESRIIDKNFYSAGAGVSLPIFVPSTWYLYSARRKGENISQHIAELSDRLIQLKTMSCYYYVLALESEKNYLYNELKAAREFSKNAKAALNVESIMPWEHEQSLQLVQSKEYALKRNQRDLEAAKMELMVTLNLHPLTDFSLEEEHIMEEPALTLEEYIYEALSNNKTLQIKGIEAEIGKDKIKIAIAEFLPKIVLNAGYYWNDNRAITDPNISFGRFTGIMSVFDGFRRVNEYKKAKKEEEILLLKREEEALKVIMETVNAYNTVEDSRDKLALAKRNYNINRDKLQQKKMEESVDYIDNSEYIKSVAEFEGALSLKKKAEFQYQMSLAALNIVLGKNLLEKGEN